MIRNLVDVASRRTIISAASPRRFEDSYTEILLKVWFEELSEPIEIIATPFDCERHTKELWIRAMAGEFGPVEVMPHRLDGCLPFIVIDQTNNTSHIVLQDPVWIANQLAAPETVEMLPSPPMKLIN